MANEVRIKLTAEQKAKIKEATGKTMNELRVETVGGNPAFSPVSAKASPRSLSARPAARAASARAASRAASARPAARAASSRPAARAATARAAARNISARATDDEEMF